MIWALLLIPTVAGAAAFVVRPDWLRRALLVLTAAAHTALTAAAWVAPVPATAGGELALDAAGLLFLSITSVLFLVAAIYACGYLAAEPRQGHADLEEGFIFSNVREATFIGCLLLFLATMTLVTVSQHMGLVWVAIEATTLTSAPLIYFHRHHRSLEATWKYLLICSVGIAIALLGNFFLAVAAMGKSTGGMRLDHLVEAARAGHLDPVWLKAAFLLMLVGYGTKMGLAPLHTWLPDAHSEAPSVVSALLSGALLNCAFLAILRVFSVLSAAGPELGQFAGGILIVFGLLSMGLAAAFIIAQADFKRMLAYSSVEHMGILALGVGLGGSLAGFGAMLHAVNHSLAKAMLFLAAGNILAACRTKSTTQVRGLLGLLPRTGVLWMLGFLIIVGMPPFGLFLSELTILKAAVDTGHPFVAGGYLLALGVVFVAMASIVLPMVYGERGSVEGRASRGE